PTTNKSAPEQEVLTLGGWAGPRLAVGIELGLRCLEEDRVDDRRTDVAEDDVLLRRPPVDAPPLLALGVVVLLHRGAVGHLLADVGPVSQNPVERARLPDRAAVRRRDSLRDQPARDSPQALALGDVAAEDLAHDGRALGVDEERALVVVPAIAEG